MEKVLILKILPITQTHILIQGNFVDFLLKFLQSSTLIMNTAEDTLQTQQFSLTILTHILIRGKIMKPAIESFENTKVK